MRKTTILSSQKGYYYASFLSEEEYRYFIINYMEYFERSNKGEVIHTHLPPIDQYLDSTFSNMHAFIDSFSWSKSKYPASPYQYRYEGEYWLKIANREAGEQTKHPKLFEPIEIEI